MRRPADALADLLLRCAVERQPVGQREALRAEWSAELHQARSGAGPVGQLRFTASLARCRMPDGTADAPLAERSVGVTRRLVALVLLAAVPVLGAVLLSIVRTGLVVAVATTATPRLLSSDRVLVLLGVASLLAVGAMVAPLALLVGLAAPLSTSDSPWWRRTLTVPVVAGLLAVSAATSSLIPSPYEPQVTPSVPVVAITTVLWVVMTVPLLHWTVARRGRALLVALPAGPVVLYLAATAGALLPARAAHAAPTGLPRWALVTLSGLPRWAPAILTGDPSAGPALGLPTHTATTLSTSFSGLPATLLLAGLFAALYARGATPPTPTTHRPPAPSAGQWAQHPAGPRAGAAAVGTPRPADHAKVAESRPESRPESWASGSLAPEAHAPEPAAVEPAGGAAGSVWLVGGVLAAGVGLVVWALAVGWLAPAANTYARSAGDAIPLWCQEVREAALLLAAGGLALLLPPGRNRVLPVTLTALLALVLLDLALDRVGGMEPARAGLATLLGVLVLLLAHQAHRLIGRPDPGAWAATWRRLAVLSGVSAAAGPTLLSLIASGATGSPPAALSVLSAVAVTALAALAGATAVLARRHHTGSRSDSAPDAGLAPARSPGRLRGWRPVALGAVTGAAVVGPVAALTDPLSGRSQYSPALALPMLVVAALVAQPGRWSPLRRALLITGAVALAVPTVYLMMVAGLASELVLTLVAQHGPDDPNLLAGTTAATLPLALLLTARPKRELDAGRA